MKTKQQKQPEGREDGNDQVVGYFSYLPYMATLVSLSMLETHYRLAQQATQTDEGLLTPHDLIRLSLQLFRDVQVAGILHLSHRLIYLQ